jgi:hypothetical protein
MDWSRSEPEQLFLKQAFVCWTKSLLLHKQRVSLREHEPVAFEEVKQGRAQSGKSGGGKSPRPEVRFCNAKRRTRIAGLPGLKESCRSSGKSSGENNKDGGETHDVSDKE